MSDDQKWYAFADEKGRWRVSDGTTVLDEMWLHPRMAEFRALKLNLQERPKGRLDP